MEKTKSSTITKVQNLKIQKEVKKPNLDKLVDKYYPRLKEQLKSEPKFAHMAKKPKLDWLTEVSNAVNQLEDQPDDIVSCYSSSSEEEEESTATNVDETFRSKLDELFGPVSP